MTERLSVGYQILQAAIWCSEVGIVTDGGVETRM